MKRRKKIISGLNDSLSVFFPSSSSHYIMTCDLLNSVELIQYDWYNSSCLTM